MKYLKTFESVNEPQVGDYVSCEENDEYFTSYFISNNIGVIIDVQDDLYFVKYNNIPKDIKEYFDEYCRDMLRDEIKFWSKSKEDVDKYIATKKYNL